jgi:hypothetical protein
MHLLKKKSKKSRNKTREKSLKAKNYSRIKQYPPQQLETTLFI